MQRVLCDALVQACQIGGGIHLYCSLTVLLGSSNKYCLCISAQAKGYTEGAGDSLIGGVKKNVRSTLAEHLSACLSLVHLPLVSASAANLVLVRRLTQTQ